MIQRVVVFIEVGNFDLVDATIFPATRDGVLTEPIPDTKHYRDERELAAALRRLADRIEKGDGGLLVWAPPILHPRT